MIEGLREGSLYDLAYVKLRRPLLEMLFDGVKWDRESAEKERNRLAKRRDEIKSGLDLLCGVRLYVINSHRSDELVCLYEIQRDLKRQYDEIPKTDRKARREFKPVVDGIAEAIRDCKLEGRHVSYEIGDGLSDSKIGEFLYGELKLPPAFKKRKDSGKSTITVDDTALKKIKLRNSNFDYARWNYVLIHDIVNLIIEHRRCVKLISTYLNPDKLLSPTDGRFHSHYKTMGTQTGRLSSGSDPWSFGGNSQNIDRDLKWLYLPG